MVQKDNLLFPWGRTLSFENHKIRFQALRNWFLSDQGRHVGQAFTAELAPLAEFLYGETLLQFGDCGDNPWLHPLHYSHKWLASPFYDSSSSVITAFNSMPFDRNSVDCIIAPLAMEAFTHKKIPSTKLTGF